MRNSNFQLILTEPNGGFAVPDIEITDDFETSFSIQNVADISQRKDLISKEITLSGTKNNNRIFNNLYLFNRESDASLTESLFYNYSPTVGVRAVLYENNYPIAVGNLKISEIDKDKTTGNFTYKGLLTGNLVTFFGNIKDKYLTDLTGFDDDVTFTVPTITGSWPFSDSAKYVFPSIDFGNGIVANTTKFDLRNFRPGIYARYYIKSILASQGYKYKSAFIDSDIFKRIYIPYNEAVLGTTVFGSYLTATGNPRSNHFSTRKSKGQFASATFQNITSNVYIDKASNVSLKSQSPGQVDWTALSDVFTIKKYATTGAKVTINFNAQFKSNIGNLHVQVIQVQPNNTLQIASPLSEQVFDFANNTVAGIPNQTITLTLPNQAYDAGFRFAVIFYISSNDEADVNMNSATVDFNSPDAGTGSTFGYSIGDTFKLSAALPKNQKATDLLKSLLNVFNMYMIENPDNNRELIIEPYDTFYNQCFAPRAYALDWTKKVDQSSLNMKISTAMPMAYEFIFKEDSDYYNTLYKNTYQDTYGNYTANNPNGTTDDSKIEPMFAGTPVVKENGDDKVLPAIYTGDITAKKSYKSQLRLLYNNGVASCASYDITLASGAGSSVTYVNVQSGLTTYNVSHHVLTLAGVNLFNLVFGLPKAVYYPATGDVFNIPNLYSFCYANQLREINDVNLFTLELDASLVEADIQALSLRTPIFIATKQGLAYFKILNLIYYSSSELSKLVLQKIILP